MPLRFIKTFRTAGLTLACLAGLSACSSVNAPKIDLMGGSAFDEDVQNIDSSIPSVDEAPEVPNDIRSDSNWDDSAKTMIEVRDGFSVPDKEYEQPSESALIARFEDLKNQAQAYKADDPK